MSDESQVISGKEEEFKKNKQYKQAGNRKVCH